jgi:cell division protein FtsB
MNWGGPEFVLTLIAISTIGWVMTTAIRARHGYPVTDDCGNTIARSDPAADRKVELLTSENERLTGQIGQLQDRLAVLERIATDPATRTAHEIDSLR